MLGIILLIFIGRQFYKLANKYEKSNSWLYPIFGIISYYFGSIVIGGIIIISVIEFILDDYIDNYSDGGLGIMMMPFGILFTYLLYKFFERKWKKEFVPIGNEIEDIGKPQDHLEA